MEENLAWLRSIGAELLCPEFMTLLAEILARNGELERAVRVVDDAIRLAETTGDRVYDPESYCLKGRILLALEPFRASEAEGLMLRARQLARERQARAFELRSATSLGRLYAEQGRIEEARLAFGDILGWFAEGFDTRDLRDATELVGLVAAPSAPGLGAAEK